jgi:hypothetical protein
MLGLGFGSLNLPEIKQKDIARIPGFFEPSPYALQLVLVLSHIR